MHVKFHTFFSSYYKTVARACIQNGRRHLLLCRVIQLVFPRAPEACLNARVSPEPFHDGSQLHAQNNIVTVASNCEQLPRIPLNKHHYTYYDIQIQIQFIELAARRLKIKKLNKQ